MKEIIREAAIGQIIRYVSGNRLLRYPEEEPDFQIPFERMMHKRKLSEINKEIDVESEVPSPAPEEAEEEEAMRKVETAIDGANDVDIEKSETSPTHHLEQLNSVRSMARTQTIPNTRERMEVERELAAQRTLSLPIQPVITSTGQVLVTWYTTDDQDNPQNWGYKKKSYVSFLIW
jgi:DHA1 family multidrug resistance protein-like MFS transporter